MAPVRWMDVSDAQAQGLALADNKTGELADWDQAALDDLLVELADEDISLEGIGWTDTELKPILDPVIDPGDAFGNLPTGGPAVSQMTFTVRPAARDDIQRAIKHARSTLDPAKVKEFNGNGLALEVLAATYLAKVRADDAAAATEAGDGA